MRAEEIYIVKLFVRRISHLFAVQIICCPPHISQFINSKHDKRTFSALQFNVQRFTKMVPLHIFCSLLLLLCANTLVSGHGNMVKPFTWWDPDQIGWTWELGTGAKTGIGCGSLDLPPEAECSDSGGDCDENWYANNVKIPGNATNLPPEMFPSGECGKEDHPWHAPGTAPIYSPCGTAGGMPNGCNDDGEGEFGDCCGSDGKCGSWAFGPNAENVEWPDMPITEWTAGSSQEVAWYVGPNHAGGYQYRLCKMPEGGVGELTEECFQQNPLEFDGKDQWINYKKDRETGDLTEVKAAQTREGTFPEGSMWRANQILRGDDVPDEMLHGHIVDNVIVPSDIEPGEYVVSFR